MEGGGQCGGGKRETGGEWTVEDKEVVGVEKERKKEREGGRKREREREKKERGREGGRERERKRERQRQREGERESVVPFPSCEYTKHVMLALLYSLSGLFCRCGCTVQCSAYSQQENSKTITLLTVPKTHNSYIVYLWETSVPLHPMGKLQ